MPDQPAIDLAINTATTRRQWSLSQAIEGYARAGITAIGPWRDEVCEMGPERAARRISDAGMKVTGLCRAGILSALDEAQFRAALDDNRRAIDEAAALGADVVVLVAGGLPSGVVELTAVRKRVAEGIAALIPDAKTAGVRLGIEPLHPVYAPNRCVINTLDQALDLCDSLDPDGDNGLGVIVDTYHVWWDPGLAEAVARAAPRTLG